MYSIVSHILQELHGTSSQKSSVKSAIYKYTNIHDRYFKKIYKLAIEITKYHKLLTDVIQTFFDNTHNDKDYFYLMIFIYELVLSEKKAKIGGKLVKSIKEKLPQIKEFIKQHKIVNGSQSKFKKGQEKDDMMYFRLVIHTDTHQNSLSSSLSIPGVQADLFIENMFYISKMEYSQSLKDIFKLRDEHKIVIQSKSSALPAYLLKLLPNITNVNKTDIIDTCSAPGNKTLQLAEYFPHSRIYAFELVASRYALLKKNIINYSFQQQIQAYHEDFLLTNPLDPRYSNVRIFLVDPSCSGSGTYNNSLIDNQDDCVCNISGSDYERAQLDRLISLAKFQRKILSHCLKFPNVKFISYSTCSIFMTENEYVVNKILSHNSNVRLVDLNNLSGTLDYHRGLLENLRGSLRMCRKCHKTDGFYVAVLEVIA